MKPFLIVLLTAAISCTSFSHVMANKPISAIVLVHGAWSDSGAWSAVEPLLKAKGHQVINVNLPGHGLDNTPFSQITLHSYVDAVKAAIGDRKDVVLVGHSMAGLVISQVAEEIPGQISKLIYLAAFLPKDGQSLLDLGKTDTDGHTGKYLQFDQANSAAIIPKEGATDVFLGGAPQATIDKVLASWKTEPLTPLSDKVHLTAARFGSVKKDYIFTAYDHSVGHTLQVNMVAATPVNKQFTLNSSHTPFFSMPDALAGILLQESE